MLPTTGGGGLLAAPSRIGLLAVQARQSGIEPTLYRLSLPRLPATGREVVQHPVKKHFGVPRCSTYTPAAAGAASPHKTDIDTSYVSEGFFFIKRMPCPQQTAGSHEAELGWPNEAVRTKRIVPREPVCKERL